MAILVVILFISILMQTLTGLLLLSGTSLFGVTLDIWRDLHVISAIILLVVIVLHIVVNWSWITTNYQRVLKH
jgi:hypothetical protein